MNKSESKTRSSKIKPRTPVMPKVTVLYIFGNTWGRGPTIKVAEQHARANSYLRFPELKKRGYKKILGVTNDPNIHFDDTGLRLKRGCWLTWIS